MASGETTVLNYIQLDIEDVNIYTTLLISKMQFIFKIKLFFYKHFITHVVARLPKPWAKQINFIEFQSIAHIYLIFFGFKSVLQLRRARYPGVEESRPDHRECLVVRRQSGGFSLFSLFVFCLQNLQTWQTFSFTFNVFSLRL